MSEAQWRPEWKCLPGEGAEKRKRSELISFSAPLLSSSYRNVTAFLLLWFTPVLGASDSIHVSRYVSKNLMLTTSVEAICFNYRPKRDNTYPIMLRLTKSGSGNWIGKDCLQIYPFWLSKKVQNRVGNRFGNYAFNYTDTPLDIPVYR